MSIKAMNWAFSLPLEPRAKLALLAIADNARDDGIAWPSRDTLAEKSSQSRATINRRLKMLAELGVLSLFERFRQDGSQTTDEIRLDITLTPEQVMQRMQGLSASERGDEGDEERVDDAARRDVVGADAPGPDDAGASRGGYQADTPPMQSGYPGDAVVTGGGLHSGHPLDEPSLEPKDSPPNPPPGGVDRTTGQSEAGRGDTAPAPVADGPLRKADRDAAAKREALWARFVQGYPEIKRMEQQAAHDEFVALSLDDAEWAVSVLPELKELLGKPKAPPPKNAHLWLRKGMFRNFPRAKIEPPAPEEVWIVEGSDEDRALRFVRGLAKVPLPFVRARADGSRGYPHKTAVGADLLAMLEFVNDVVPRWTGYPRGTPRFEAWQGRFVAWIGQRLPTEPGSDCIRAPCPWPPKKDGTIYRDESGNEEESQS